jgi:hypothetical protein
MPRLKCPSCSFAISLSRREADIGMLCPECHCSRLIVQRKERKANRVVTLRSGTVRAIVGCVICILLGPILLGISIPNLGGRAGILWARVTAFGGLLILMGIGCFVAALVGLYKDLK